MVIGEDLQFDVREVKQVISQIQSGLHERRPNAFALPVVSHGHAVLPTCRRRHPVGFIHRVSSPTTSPPMQATNSWVASYGSESRLRHSSPEGSGNCKVGRFSEV